MSAAPVLDYVAFENTVDVGTQPYSPGLEDVEKLDSGHCQLAVDWPAVQ